ncbi:hypothetical protein [Halarsenatibacter silvermanii]|uniref:Uncharacterized protein n=1 Tax=Halarsenatibacter silvermanii TaxID=321763 RepID=A0A1G9HRG7_9FIRM|nr:hypothetical protein [Halarsenatibacter silvermanii]SDL15581.1 hypothetical protein SAMN04488692_10216 [Halarsenatibacter silvermanii]
MRSEKPRKASSGAKAQKNEVPEVMRDQTEEAAERAHGGGAGGTPGAAEPPLAHGREEPGAFKAHAGRRAQALGDYGA